MENLQLVLSGDKGVATDLTIFLSDSEKDLFVYLGVALLERVENNRNEFAYKMLLGRLVNAGVKLSKLTGLFKHDARTLKRWSEGLKSDDPDFIVRVFAGRGPLPKVIGPMIRFVKMRYLSLKGVIRNYRQVIGNEVKACFGEKISRETLRQLFTLANEEQQKAKIEKNVKDKRPLSREDLVPLQQDFLSDLGSSEEVKLEGTGCPLLEVPSTKDSFSDKYSPRFLVEEESPAPPPLEMDSSDGISAESQCSEKQDESSDIEFGLVSAGNGGYGADGGSISPPRGAGLPYSGVQPTPQLRALQHVGQILFSPWLDMVSFQRQQQASGLQSQWIGQILQGAVNIEQSRLICNTSLALFTGPVVSGVKAQRTHLKNMANAQAILDVYEANLRLLPDGPGMGDIFFMILIPKNVRPS